MGADPPHARGGIRLFQDVLDPGACPGPDPGFAGATILETFYEIIKYKQCRMSWRPKYRTLASGTEHVQDFGKFRLTWATSRYLFLSCRRMGFIGGGWFKD